MTGLSKKSKSITTRINPPLERVQPLRQHKEVKPLEQQQRHDVPERRPRQAEAVPQRAAPAAHPCHAVVLQRRHVERPHCPAGPSPSDQNCIPLFHGGYGLTPDPPCYGKCGYHKKQSLVGHTGPNDGSGSVPVISVGVCAQVCAGVTSQFQGPNSIQLPPPPGGTAQPHGARQLLQRAVAGLSGGVAGSAVQLPLGGEADGHRQGHEVQQQQQPPLQRLPGGAAAASHGGGGVGGPRRPQGSGVGLAQCAAGSAARGGSGLFREGRQQMIFLFQVRTLPSSRKEKTLVTRFVTPIFSESAGLQRRTGVGLWGPCSPQRGR